MAAAWKRHRASEGGAPGGEWKYICSISFSYHTAGAFRSVKVVQGCCCCYHRHEVKVKMYDVTAFGVSGFE